MDGYKIISLLKRQKINVKDIASNLGVSGPAVSMVIHGHYASRRISQAIADAIGRPLAEVFPRYSVDISTKKAPSSGHNTAVAAGTTITVPEDGQSLQAAKTP